MNQFARDVAITAVANDRYAATVGEGWMRTPGKLANGGYLAALGARAMSAAVNNRDPVSVTTHYLAPVDPGEVFIQIEVVRDGRRHATVMGRMLQGERECVRYLGAFGTLREAPTVIYSERKAPDWPPPDACIDWVTTAFPDPATRPPIVNRYDLRVPPHLGMYPVPPTGDDVTSGGYFKWPDADDVDLFGVLVAADRFPSSLFNVPGAPDSWAPTIEMTVQLFARPVPGRLTVRCASRIVTDPYFEEDGDIWDSDGNLIAVTRQIALIGAPKGS